MKICVLGAGTWGIALAALLCANDHNVSVWSAIPSEIDNLVYGFGDGELNAVFA